MDLGRLLNVVVAVALALRSVWWLRDVILNMVFPQRMSPHDSENRTAQNSLAREMEHGKFMNSVLQRCNASIIYALLGDAAAYGTQHRYIHSGFAVSVASLTSDGASFRDLASALKITPATGRNKNGGGGHELGSHVDVNDRVGLNTKYGNHLLMTLRLILPVHRESVVDFETFQDAWYRWQLGMPHEDRGKAAEITLKNLERGLIGRHAATLVGDIGATPRLPVLVTIFALDACRRLRSARNADDERVILQEAEDLLSQAAQEITMTTHDRAESLVGSAFLARVAFRLAFQTKLLLPTSEWHPLDRHTAPSIFWRAVRSVRKSMSEAFLRQAYIDAERLCMRQSRRAPLAGEMGGARYLDPKGDLEDLGMHHTERLPTPQSNERQRELFGLSGGMNAALPAILYLAWKYERHPAAALTANTLLGGNSAGRAVVLGMLLGFRVGTIGEASQVWLAQMRSARETLGMLADLSVRPATYSDWHLRYKPCPANLCHNGGQVSKVTTSFDVQIVAIVTNVGRQGEGQLAERHALVQLNVSNLGFTGMPICPHGKLWLLWEAGGFARGRFRSLGNAAINGVANVAEYCLAPMRWRVFAVNVSTSEPEALKPGEQHMVGLLEIVRPLRDLKARQRLQQPGAGNLISAIVDHDGAVEVCEHFAAKVGRFDIPSDH